MSTKPSSQDGHAGDDQNAQPNNGNPSDTQDDNAANESQQTNPDTGHEPTSKWEGLSDEEIERRLSDRIVSKKDNALKTEQALRKEIAKTARNTNYVFTIEDPSLANQVVQELWGEDGISTVSDLRDYLKEETKPVSSGGDDLSEIKKEISEIKSMQQKAKDDQEMKIKKKIMNNFFEKYPQYAPHVDTDGSEWLKLKNKLRITSIDTLADDLEDAHYLINRHNYSSQDAKDAAMVGGGSQVRPKVPLRASDEDIRAANAVGMDIESYLKHKSSW